MEELSIEQKAARYDYAKSIMEKYLKSGNAGVIAENTIKNAFPELKESEDERIRKELLEHCKNQAKPYIQTGNECHQIQSWIDWLEKQGVQNQDCKAKREAEQKPTGWSEEDEICLQNTLIAVKDKYPVGSETINPWLKSLKARVQPKPDWSEEDERMFTRIEEAIKSYYVPFSKDAEEMLNWFNPIKDRVHPQNIIVTDEELANARNEAYNDALDKIEYHSESPTFGDGWSAAIWYLKKKNVQFNKNWAPTVEQMDTLYKYAEQNNYDGSVLTSLYNELKKLKG